MANRNLFRLEMLILKILKKGDCYGYELTQTLKEKTNGRINIAEGTLYPILYKLVDQGLISDEKRLIGKRQTRVYYHIEESGKAHYEQLLLDYHGMLEAIDSILNEDDE